jgi:hypothetical protein
MTLLFGVPALLVGLAAVAVPLLIHFISKRRARVVRFALIDLLMRSQRRTARSIRLQQILLLLLRMLFIAAVAVALAQPFLDVEQAPAARAEPIAVVVVIDGSASMHARVGGRSGFERARREALDLIRGLPADVKAGAVACGGKSEPGAAELAPVGFDRAGVLTAIEEHEAGVFAGALVPCIDRAVAMVQGVEGAGERRVTVLSDLAAHAIQSVSSATDGKGVLVQWRSVVDRPMANHAIVQASVVRVAGRAGTALSVPFSLAGFAPDGATIGDVEVDLIHDGSRSARLTVPVSPRPTERRFHLPMPERTAAPVSGGKTSDSSADAVLDTLTITTPADALTLDDTVVLPVDMGGPLEVVVVDGAPQALRFQDEVFYLESALEAVRGGRARLKFRTIGADQLQRADVAAARVLVLANVARLDDDAALALVEHVKAGAGVLMTMGDQVDVEWTNAQLRDLLPSPLRGSKGQALLDDASVAEVLSLTRFMLAHPALSSFGAPQQSGTVGAQPGAALDVPGLTRVRTHTMMLVEPAADQQTVVARFSNGAPALVDRAVGAGRAMTLLTTVDRDWTDLAIRPGFVPLMQQIVLYLGGALDDAAPRVQVVGGTRQLRVPLGAVEVVVEKPSGSKLILPVPVDARTVTLPRIDEIGLHRIWSRGDGGELRERAAERFTAVFDAAESDLRPATPADLNAAVPPGATVQGGGPDDPRVKLWPMLLMLAAALLLAEAALLKRTLM